MGRRNTHHLNMCKILQHVVLFAHTSGFGKPFTFNTSVQLKVCHWHPINWDKKILPHTEKLSYPIHSHFCQVLIKKWACILLSSSGLISLLSPVSGRQNGVLVRNTRLRITIFLSSVTAFLSFISKWLKIT